MAKQVGQTFEVGRKILWGRAATVGPLERWPSRARRAVWGIPPSARSSSWCASSLGPVGATVARPTQSTNFLYWNWANHGFGAGGWTRCRESFPGAPGNGSDGASCWPAACWTSGRWCCKWTRICTSAFQQRNSVWKRPWSPCSSPDSRPGCLDFRHRSDWNPPISAHSSTPGRRLRPDGPAQLKPLRPLPAESAEPSSSFRPSPRAKGRDLAEQHWQCWAWTQIAPAERKSGAWPASSFPPEHDQQTQTKDSFVVESNEWTADWTDERD